MMSKKDSIYLVLGTAIILQYNVQRVAGHARISRDLEGNRYMGCGEDEYWSDADLMCKSCSYCPAGYVPLVKEGCGYGIGRPWDCVPCEPGISYSLGIKNLHCTLCTSCEDRNRSVLEEALCTIRHDAQCGPCLPGTEDRDGDGWCHAIDDITYLTDSVMTSPSRDKQSSGRDSVWVIPLAVFAVIFTSIFAVVVLAICFIRYRSNRRNGNHHVAPQATANNTRDEEHDPEQPTSEADALLESASQQNTVDNTGEYPDTDEQGMDSGISTENQSREDTSRSSQRSSEASSLYESPTPNDELQVSVPARSLNSDQPVSARSPGEATAVKTQSPGEATAVKTRPSTIPPSGVEQDRQQDLNPPRDSPVEQDGLQGQDPPAQPSGQQTPESRPGEGINVTNVINVNVHQTTILKPDINQPTSPAVPPTAPPAPPPAAPPGADDDVTTVGEEEAGTHIDESGEINPIQETRT